MIDKVTIRNFKCLRDVRISLEQFTVFVGPNASGKSSILEGLHRLCSFFSDPIESPFVMQLPGASPPISMEDQWTQARTIGSVGPVEVIADCDGKGYRYRTDSPSSMRPHKRTDQSPRGGTPSWDGQGRGFNPDMNSESWSQWRPSPSDARPLPQSIFLRLVASKLIDSSPNQIDPTVMAPDGSGLHSALANMALNDPDSWQQLQENLRGIIPTIRRLRHTKTSMSQHAALLFDTIGGDSLPASQVSEGTLLVLGLLAAFHAPDRPNLILLDDLDRGLHPRAQKDLVSLLRRLLDTNADLQIAATTHSPYLLDCVQPREVRMTTLGDDGSTVCASIEKHPRFEKWKDEMAPGEMWSLFGEKWLTEGAAAS